MREASIWSAEVGLTVVRETESQMKSSGFKNPVISMESLPRVLLNEMAPMSSHERASAECQGILMV